MSLRISRIGFCLLIVSWIGTSSIRVNAEELDLKKLQSEIYSAVSKVLPASVAISDRGMVFSGVIVSADGLVLSAGHAVRPSRRYTVMLPDGRRFRAVGLGVNERVDMAMVRIVEPDNLPVAELGHSSTIVRDQPVLSISYPGMHDRDRGAVIRFGYVNRPITNNEGMIESTAMMEPGDSGGPLLDLNGKVIGIHSNIRRSSAQNYDVPIDSFRQYWDQLQEPGEFKISGWPSLPKLGFHAEDGESGVNVIKVTEGGLAESAGLKPEDVITKISGKRVRSRQRIYDRLIELRTAGTSLIEVSVLRNARPASVTIEIADAKHVTPKSYPGLRNLEKQLQTLESRLDNVQFVVNSQINGVSTQVWATRIFRNGRGNLVSKSTRVGEQPQVILANGSRVAAEVVARDLENDLVLLDAKFVGLGGIEIAKVVNNLPEQRGRLLLTPDANGDGRVSIWGSKYFDVPRTKASGGYLGVQIGVDGESGRVVFERVYSGGAKSAGVQSGDVLLKLNEMPVKRRDDVFDFLRQLDPNTRIKAVIGRDEEELTKEIVLGNRPEETGHLADVFAGGKSDRRDGFTLAVSHDANLRPRECGGPVFDISGNFLGINIARFSRTRCYIVPAMIIKQFVDQYGG